MLQDAGHDLSNRSESAVAPDVSLRDPIRPGPPLPVTGPSFSGPSRVGDECFPYLVIRPALNLSALAAGPMELSRPGLSTDTCAAAIEQAVQVQTAALLKRPNSTIDFGVRGADKSIVEPPEWYRELAHKALLRQRSGHLDRDWTVTAVDLRPEILKAEFGFITRPNLVEYLAAGQKLHIFDIRGFSHALNAFGFNGTSQQHGKVSIPCPYNSTFGTSTPVAHLTESTGKYAFRAFAASPSRVDFAYCAVERCKSCGTNFLHSNSVLLSRLPRFIGLATDISYEGNDGDPAVIISDTVLQEARANERMRQGSLNTEKKCREATGNRAARASFCFFEHKLAYLAALEERVGDDVWGRLSEQEKSQLVTDRAELSAYKAGAMFDAWPSDVPSRVLLASPILTRSVKT